MEGDLAGATAGSSRWAEARCSELAIAEFVAERLEEDAETRPDRHRLRERLTAGNQSG